MNDSGLTDNAWVNRVSELRQMVDDVMTPDLTADDAEYYISEWGIEYDDEKAVLRREFERRIEREAAQ